MRGIKWEGWILDRERVKVGIWIEGGNGIDCTVGGFEWPGREEEDGMERRMD